MQPPSASVSFCGSAIFLCAILNKNNNYHFCGSNLCEFYYYALRTGVGRRKESHTATTDILLWTCLRQSIPGPIHSGSLIWPYFRHATLLRCASHALHVICGKNGIFWNQFQGVFHCNLHVFPEFVQFLLFHVFVWCFRWFFGALSSLFVKSFTFLASLRLGLTKPLFR